MLILNDFAPAWKAMSNEQWVLCQALSGLTNILLDNASIVFQAAWNQIEALSKTICFADKAKRKT